MRSHFFIAYHARNYVAISGAIDVNRRRYFICLVVESNLEFSGDDSNSSMIYLFLYFLGRFLKRGPT